MRIMKNKKMLLKLLQYFYLKKYLTKRAIMKKLKNLILKVIFIKLKRMI